MEIWAKIINKKIKYPPKNDPSKGLFNVDKNQQWLLKHGYTKWTMQDLNKHTSTPSKEPKRYSTLKIIRNLGTQWNTYRKSLQKAGVLDQFFAANYLSQTDPVFMAFIQQVPQQIKAKLTLCEWENN